jgi:hypothetical protein
LAHSAASAAAFFAFSASALACAAAAFFALPATFLVFSVACFLPAIVGGWVVVEVKVEVKVEVGRVW